MIAKIKAWAKRLKREGYALTLAIRDPRTPWLAKALAIATVAYAVSPIDLIPDFIPVLGFVDDAILLPAMIWLAVRLIPDEVMIEARARVDAQLAAPKALMRAGLIAVVVIWIALLAALAAWLLA
ncbi:MAG TPA: YkvA family protein [Alphaproteobacteria bacterium]|nr:YkvA family protein [Alphaproteobacteria bacterium]